MKPVLVLTTVHAAFDAAALARELVEMRLAACVNILPGFTSIYRWEGKVETRDEVLLVIKTTQARLGTLTLRISELHAYEVPEVLVASVEDGASRYLEWLAASVAPAK